MMDGRIAVNGPHQNYCQLPKTGGDGNFGWPGSTGKHVHYFVVRSSFELLSEPIGLGRAVPLARLDSVVVDSTGKMIEVLERGNDPSELGLKSISKTKILLGKSSLGCSDTR